MLFRSQFKAIIYVNPLTYYIEAFRDLSLYNVIPDVGEIIKSLIISASVFVGGLVFFNRVRNAFSDVV